MKIDRVELYYLHIPLSRDEPGFFAERTVFHPNWIPGYHQTDVRLYLLKLSSDSGHEGYAAVPAMGLERAGLGALLGAYLIGLNPLDIRLLNQRIQEFGYLGMRNGWVEAAFWDLIGKIRGEPVWRLLGGSGGHVYPYASLGSTHGHDPETVARLVRKRRGEGYRGVKIRVKSLDLPRMVEVVAAAREAAGPSLKLMVDANLGWPVDLVEASPRWDEDFAARFAQAIEPHAVTWLEEPLHRCDIEGMARLRRRTRTPIAGGEMNSTFLDFKAMLAAGSLDVYQPDAMLAGGTLAGGITEVRWLIGAIQAKNAQRAPGEPEIRYSPHTWTNGLGFAVNLQLMSLVPPEERGLLELPDDVNWQPAQWARFLRADFSRDAEGRIQIPDAPGLGVAIDWGIVRRFGRRIYLGTSLTLAAATLRDLGLREALSLRKRRAALLEQSARAELRLPEPPF